MRPERALSAVLIALLAACGTGDSVAGPELDPQGVAQAKSDKKVKLDKDQKKACVRTSLTLHVAGEITPDDCLYDLAGRDQREDLYSVRPKDLVKESGLSIDGAPRMTFTADAGFDGLFGLTRADKNPFGGLVHGSRTFPANTPRSFSVVGSEKEYGMFFSGYDDTQLGGYVLTTSVAPGGTFQCGELVFLVGSSSFPGSISDANSCAGTIVFGPYAGNPLRYQYRYAKFEAGKTYTVTISGIDPGAPEVALFIARFAGGGVIIDDTLDLGGGPGDPDRSITLTASVDGYYYIEVSTIPGKPSGYTFAYTEH